MSTADLDPDVRPIAEAMLRDAKVAGIAATGTYAGDEDPYLKPREGDDED